MCWMLACHLPCLQSGHLVAEIPAIWLEGEFQRKVFIQVLAAFAIREQFEHACLLWRLTYVTRQPSGHHRNRSVSTSSMADPTEQDPSYYERPPASHYAIFSALPDARRQGRHRHRRLTRHRRRYRRRATQTWRKGILAPRSSSLLTQSQVTVTYTSASSIPSVEELLTRYPATDLTSIRADLRNPESPAAIIKHTLTAFSTSHIDILVNNAGINRPTPLSTLTTSDFSEVFDTNVRAMVLMTQAVLPHLPPRHARIINIGSTAARIGVPEISLYTASKAAVEAMTRSWVAELGSRGVTVNTVAPGSVESELLRGSAGRDDVEEEARRTPVEGRVGTPEDVGRVVAWLAGEESLWVSGQCLCVSGGYRMW